MMQLVTGITLSMHYYPDLTLAFDSIEHIHRDISYGIFIRYAHSNGASLFFIMVYLHLGKAFYYNSYLMALLWYSGIIILYSLSH
jgi:quinol-cytochrome oxidoreductase complex cytochrome b subunit